LSTSPPGRRERKKQAIRDKICEETQRLVSIHGVEGTTIDAICDCTDIAKKTFYNYYSSKSDLLIDLCKLHLLNHVDGLVDDAVKNYQGLAPRLKHVFEQIKARATTGGRFENELLAFMVGNLSADLTQGADQITHMNQCFLRLFEASKQEIKPPLTAEFCAEMIVGMINTLTLNRLHFPSYDSDKNYDLLLDYLLGSMLVDE
jgi:AcrR family transcriptional regulator